MWKVLEILPSRMVWISTAMILKLLPECGTRSGRDGRLARVQGPAARARRQSKAAVSASSTSAMG
jgi:hypothetical protein